MKDELQGVFQLINDQKIDEAKIASLNKELIEQIEANLENIPANLADQWKQIQLKSKEIIDVKGKFKWNVSIIPGLLKYEKEIAFKIPIIEWAKKWWGGNFNL